MWRKAGTKTNRKKWRRPVGCSLVIGWDWTEGRRKAVRDFEGPCKDLNFKCNMKPLNRSEEKHNLLKI